MPIFKKPPFRGNADKKRDMPEGLWHKCPGCGEVIHELELKKSLRVCPHCNYHFTLSAPERIESITDPGTFTETDKEMASVDALNFKGIYFPEHGFDRKSRPRRIGVHGKL